MAAVKPIFQKLLHPTQYRISGVTAQRAEIQPLLPRAVMQLKIRKGMKMSDEIVKVYIQTPNGSSVEGTRIGDTHAS